MITVMSELEEKLKELKITKKASKVVSELLKNQLYIYKKTAFDVSRISFIVACIKDEITLIRIFEQKDIFLESLDNSCEKYKDILKLSERNIKFLLWVSFIDDGKYISVERCKISDIKNMKLKKVKNISYAVSDGSEVIKLDIVQADVKGVENDTLQDMVKYVFKKRTKKEKEPLDLAVVGYEY